MWDREDRQLRLMLDTPYVTDAEKERVWQGYRSGCPERVPVALRTNDRVYVLDPRFNREGLTYRDMFSDPLCMLRGQLQWQKLLRQHFHRYCDYPTGYPDTWRVVAFFHNVYEAWALGCEVRFESGQVPDTLPRYTDNNKRAVFDVDIDHPLQLEPFRRAVEFTEHMRQLARGLEFEGRPVEVLPYLHLVSDGPLTVALNLRGGEFLIDLVSDPEYADQLMAFITEAAIKRARALMAYWGEALPPELWLADDSIALISEQMYQERVLPHHRRFYETLDPERRATRLFHLCGDATRHFPAIVRHCGVRAIDTGFPVDFAWLRQAVGAEVEIWGGVQVSLLLHGTPAQVAERVREVLDSGVRAGGKFILTEANNLPPGVPTANLAALYQAALEFGKYR